MILWEKLFQYSNSSTSIPSSVSPNQNISLPSVIICQTGTPASRVEGIFSQRCSEQHEQWTLMPCHSLTLCSLLRFPPKVQGKQTLITGYKFYKPDHLRKRPVNSAKITWQLTEGNNSYSKSDTCLLPHATPSQQHVRDQWQDPSGGVFTFRTTGRGRSRTQPMCTSEPRQHWSAWQSDL